MNLRSRALHAAATVVLAMGGCANAPDDSAIDLVAVNPSEPPVCELNDDIDDCCRQMKTWCGTHHAAGGDAYDECVFGPDFDGSTGCIPWGPPVPPSLSAPRRAA